MFELLEKIRNKPEGTRKFVAVMISLSVTGFIFVIWLSVIFPNWLSDKEKEERVLTKGPSPVSTMAATVYESVNSIGDQFSKIKSAILLLTSSQTSTSTSDILPPMTDEE